MIMHIVHLPAKPSRVWAANCAARWLVSSCFSTQHTQFLYADWRGDCLPLYCLQLCNDWAIGGKSGLAKIKGQLWGASTVGLSFLDWPLRK